MTSNFEVLHVISGQQVISLVILHDLYVVSINQRIILKPYMYVCLLSFLKSNLLEASPELMKRDSEKEWYYGNKEKERLGPFSFEEVSTTKSIFFCPCL